MPVGETYVLVDAGAQVKVALKAVLGSQTHPDHRLRVSPVQCLQTELTRETDDLLLHGQLARCAEPVDATHWRLTTASLARVRQAGVPAGALLAFLQSRVQGMVPALLEIVIGDVLVSAERWNASPNWQQTVRETQKPSNGGGGGEVGRARHHTRGKRSDVVSADGIAPLFLHHG